MKRHLTITDWVRLRGRVHSKQAVTPLPTQAGFTLTEAFVGLLVAAIFLSTTMQMLVAATFVRVRAEQADSADVWIRSDLEAVKQLTQQYEMAVQPYSTRCSATVAANGLAAGFIQDGTQGLGGTTKTDGPRQLGGNTFVLERTASYANTSDPFRLVRLTYRVIPEGGTAEITTKTVEVVPLAVLRCGYSPP